MRKLQIGSCFSGIGGLELGLEATGFFETKWQVEIEDFPTKVLEKHWPGVRRWRDVRTFPPEGDWSCDILVAGFPCQDISTAGPGGGLSGERSGLFYELLRIIDLIRPRWLLLENVPAILYRGADDVLRHLAEIGLRNDNPHFRRMESHCFRQPTLARLTDVIGGSALPTPNTLDHTGSGRMNTNANVKKWGGINSLGGMAATGLWPTPSAADTRDRGHLGTGCMNKRIKDGRQLLLSQCVSTESGLLNPKFVEWLMGLPPGYTVLND